jgi:hypothetical protein
MDRTRLEQLGFTVTDAGRAASLELLSPLLNPLTRKLLDRAEFGVDGARLTPTAPPELVGTGPFSVLGLERLAEFEDLLRAAIDGAVLQLQRRSGELQALGLSTQVDPERLALWAEVPAGPRSIRIAADKLGRFAVEGVTEADRRHPVAGGPTFELSEFRELSALAGFLEALVADSTGGAPAERPEPAVPVVRIQDLAEAFGPQAIFPTGAPLELLVELRVEGQPYRFAAARISGRTFRGLLAGRRGKVWAGRFDLLDFPGVAVLAADILGVPLETVEGAGPSSDAPAQ